MLRWRMLRQGAHQVKRPSLSGSSARPTSTQPGRQHTREQRALVRALADGVRLALPGMHVALLARDVDVAAHDEAAPPRRVAALYASIASRNAILAAKSLPPLGT